MIIEVNSKKFKLYALQKKYKLISNLIKNLQDHITYLYDFHLIDTVNRNYILGNLYDINKDINKIYNNIINEEFPSNEENVLNITDEKMFPHIENWNDMIRLTQNKGEKTPFLEIFNSIKDIINANGYSDIKDIFEFNLGFLWRNHIDKSSISIISEISENFVPMSFSSFDVDSQNKPYYWRIPTIYNSYDYLELTRELWIKDNRYEKIY